MRREDFAKVGIREAVMIFFIWFVSPLCRNFQGPLVYPSNPFLFLHGPWKNTVVRISSLLHILALTAYVMIWDTPLVRVGGFMLPGWDPIADKWIHAAYVIDCHVSK
jgi:hypothetical protein